MGRHRDGKSDGVLQNEHMPVGCTARTAVEQSSCALGAIPSNGWKTKKGRETGNSTLNPPHAPLRNFYCSVII